jgi:hypothetical protein
MKQVFKVLQPVADLILVMLTLLLLFTRALSNKFILNFCLKTAL